jgi:hypothetical protein
MHKRLEMETWTCLVLEGNADELRSEIVVDLNGDTAERIGTISTKIL